MLGSVLQKSLRDQRRPLLWWGLGMVALFLVTILFYPSIKGATGLDALLKQMPEALLKAFVGESLDFTSPAGFLNSQLFQLMFPLLLLIYSIRLGAEATAGEEERGTIDLLLACPLPRRRLVLDKAASIAIGTALLASITWAGMWVGIVLVHMKINLVYTLEATLSALLLSLVFGMFAMAVGAATGKKSLATGLPAAVAVAAYLLNALAPLVDRLAAFRKLSPFYEYIGADPLANGLNPAHASVLAGIAVVMVAIAVVAFSKRDVGT